MRTIMSRTVLTLLAIFIKLLAGVSAQVNTSATCQSQYSWMSNSKGQSPCLVAAYLQAQCNNGTFQMSNISYPGYYSPVGANACTCSTVTYSMVTACGFCQDANTPYWTQWSSACSAVYLQQYTPTIPAETAIPHWAYLNVVILNGLDVTAAREYLNTAPDSTATSSTTSISSMTSTLSLSSTSMFSPSPSPPMPPAHHPMNNKGAIAGGVVGGLIALGLIGVIAVILIRRCRDSGLHPPTNVPLVPTGPKSHRLGR